MPKRESSLLPDLIVERIYDRANPKRKLNIMPEVMPVTAIIVYPLLARAAQMNRSGE